MAATMSVGRTGAAENDHPTAVGLDGLLVLAALAAATIGQGGYYPRVSAVCGGILVAAVCVFASRRRAGALSPSRPALAGLAVMALCTVAVAGIDGHPSGANGVVALLAGMAIVVVIAAGSPAGSRRLLADAAVCLGSVAAIAGWLGVAFRVQPFAHVDGGLWRAATTLTYANASAALLAPLALWAMARCVTRDDRLSRAAVVVLVAGLGATMSRAGLGGFAIGLCVLCVVLRPGQVWKRAAPALAGGLVAVAGLVPGMEASGPARPWWAVLGLLAGVAVGTRRLPDLLTRRPCRLRVWLLAFAVVAAAGVVALGMSGVSGVWAGRLSAASPARSSLAVAALRMWQSHPVTGVGPGEAVFVWSTPQHQLLFDRYAHDEYLQLAAEEGLVGVAGLVVLVGGLAMAMRRRKASDDPGAPEAALRAGAIAGLAAVAFHSGFDFLWHVPVIPLFVALAVGLATPLPPVSETPQQQQTQSPKEEVPCM